MDTESVAVGYPLTELIHESISSSHADLIWKTTGRKANTETEGCIRGHLHHKTGALAPKRHYCHRPPLGFHCPGDLSNETPQQEY